MVMKALLIDLHSPDAMDAVAELAFAIIPSYTYRTEPIQFAHAYNKKKNTNQLLLSKRVTTVHGYV